MFQYTFAMQVRRMSGEKQICINGILHPLSKDGRVVSLHHFKLLENTSICSGIHSIIKAFQFIFAVLTTCGVRGTWNFVKHIAVFQKTKNGNVEIDKEDIYFTTNAFRTPKVRMSTGLCHIYGGFQNVATIEGIVEDLRTVFTVKTVASSANREMLADIQSCNAVCLHVRRGDYGLYPQLQVCNEKYYTTALEHARRVLKSPTFYVFSTGHEDIEWVKKNYSFGPNVKYVDLDNPDYEEIRLMMSCKHFIISNSTFSWWAAILSSAAGTDKKVWAPKEWMKENSTSMLPDSWFKVDN